MTDPGPALIVRVEKAHQRLFASVVGFSVLMLVLVAGAYLSLYTEARRVSDAVQAARVEVAREQSCVPAPR